MELIAGVAELKTSAPLQTRVGIATGLVVVGDLIGTGSAQEQTIVGETPNLAARTAKPNMVVIAENTRKLRRIFVNSLLVTDHSVDQRIDVSLRQPIC
jgi:class 3 adenylate cyclase